MLNRRATLMLIQHCERMCMLMASLIVCPSPVVMLRCATRGKMHDCAPCRAMPATGAAGWAAMVRTV